MNTALVDYLVSLARRDDRAVLAKLRRGLGKEPGEATEMLPIVVPFLPPEPYLQDAFFTVATLFGLHPKHAETGCLGDVLRRLRKPKARSDAPDPIERRFVALLNCHESELPGHLRHAISLARTKELAVDYKRLLRDVARWGAPERYVQLAWARSFWGGHDDQGQQKQEIAVVADARQAE